MLMVTTANSPEETQKIAADLAEKILSEKRVYPESSRGAKVIALEGELGAGKTTFVQGFAKALGIKENLTSPTFVIIKVYSLQLSVYRNLIHIDAYRLKDYKELEALEVREMIADPKNIIMIEWSDRVIQILPEKYIKVHIDHISEKNRKIQVTDL